MLKTLVILLLLATVIVGTACRHSVPISSPTPTEIPQSQFIPILRQVSAPFDKFYGNEIESLNPAIHWFYEPNQPLTTAYTHPIGWDYKAANIYLKHIPNPDEGSAALEKDAFLVAHELATLVVGPSFQENWMLQCDNKEFHDRFLDMISTPLRDHVLASYGFDVAENFRSKLQSDVLLPCVSPNNRLITEEYAFGYVRYVLYSQYVLGNQSIPSQLDSFLQKCSPNAEEEGRDMLIVIGDLRNATSDRVKAWLEDIIYSHNLPCQIVESSQPQ